MALLETSTHKATTIPALQTRVDQLELSFSAPPSINITAIQDNLEALRRDLDRLQAGPPCAPTTGTPRSEQPHLSINVVSGSASTGPVGSFKPNFKEKYNTNEGSITYLLYVYESAIKEATYRLKVEHLASFLILSPKRLWYPFMSCHTWITGKEALISEFGGAQNYEIRSRRLYPYKFVKEKRSPLFPSASTKKLRL